MKKTCCKNFKLMLFATLLFSTCITLSIYTWRIKNFQRNYADWPLLPAEAEYSIKRVFPASWKDKLRKKIGCHDRPLVMEKVQYGTFWLLRNYIRGRRSVNIGCAESITYAANSDYTFLGNLAYVVTRYVNLIHFHLSPKILLIYPHLS